MKPATVALRDQLAAVLRATDGALSTDELAHQMPPISGRRLCHRWNCDGPPSNPFIITEVCGGDGMHTYTRRMHGPEVYPHLRAMERKGLCSRVHVPDHRPVYWLWTGPVDEVLLHELEAAWAASA